jgi:hypothetical protein
MMIPPDDSSWMKQAVVATFWGFCMQVARLSHTDSFVKLRVFLYYIRIESIVRSSEQV